MSEKILIATKEILTAEMLKILINNKKLEKSITTLHDGQKALDFIINHRPKLILVELYLPVLSTLALMEELSKVNLYPRVVCVCNEVNKVLGVKLFKNGVSGLIDYKTSMDDARKIMKQVEAGKRVIPAAIEGAIEDRDFETNREKYTPMTTRQSEVLHLTGEGYSNPEIAYKLNITEKTVEMHKRKIRDKMGLSSAIEIAVYAITHGFVEVKEVRCL